MARTYTGRYKLDGEFRATTVALGIADKQAAEAKVNEIVRLREREKAGILAPKIHREAAQKALRLHLSDFLGHLEFHKRALKYRQNLEARIGRVLNGCAWNRLCDITAASFQLWQKQQTKASAKTQNDYLDAIRAFLNWMMEDERTEFNPLAPLTKIDTTGEEVRVRRAVCKRRMKSAAPPN